MYQLKYFSRIPYSRDKFTRFAYLNPYYTI